jgi:uncharacterized protein YukE
MNDPKGKFEILQRRSEMAGDYLQRLADELGRRAEQWARYGYRNQAVEAELADRHAEALERLLDIGDQLEAAAVEAGYLAKRDL